MNFLSTYWAAWLAAGAVAAAIPVIIHLVHTARAPQVPFPTLRFLRSAAQKTARRRHVENLLLMLLRMVLLACLALALARPFVSETFGLFAESQNTAAILILDNSYSMNVRFQQDTRLAKAKQEARAILESRWRPAQAALLLTNPGPAPVADRLAEDRAALFKTLDGARISSGRADLVGALRAAYALLEKTGATEKRIWVLTDRQALSWEGLQKLEEPGRHPEIPVAVIRATEPVMRNAAVTDLTLVSSGLAAGLPVRIDATLRNGGPAPEQPSVLLLVDDFGQALRKETVDLAPAGSPAAGRVVSFTHVFDRPGPHQVMVAIDGADSLDLDDTRRLAVQIADRVPVLAVKQQAAATAYQDDNFYLLWALDPMRGAGATAWPIKPVETTVAQLDPAALDRADVAILNNVEGLPPATVKALADFVAAGRTLVVFCGPHSSPAEYNRLFMDPFAAQGGLLPARLKERVGDPILKNTVEKIREVQDRSPWLEGLVESPQVYEDILVYSYLRTEGAAADAVLVRLAGGDPLLLEKSFGRGRVLLFTTGATPDLTNLPLRNLFLPLMMRIAHASSRSQGRAAQLMAGQPFQTDLAPEVKTAVTVEMTGPLGPSGEILTELPNTQPAGGRNLLEFKKTWNLGYYRWRAARGGDAAGVFCTNVDGAESDLSETADEKLRADLGARETHVAGSLAELVSRFEAGSHRELWQYILIVCLVVAVCEPLVANWMRPDRRPPSPRRPSGRRKAA
jgi:hypothetical protein